MTPVAVYDACVLYPSPLRDFLIRVAIEDLVVARWSARILDEVFRNIAVNRPDLDTARLARTRDRMCAAVLDCVVEGSEDIEAAITLPDPDDRHVVAAAIRAGAGSVITLNLRDFPAVELARNDSSHSTPTCSRWNSSRGAPRSFWTCSPTRRPTSSALRTRRSMSSRRWSGAGSCASVRQSGVAVWSDRWTPRISGTVPEEGSLYLATRQLHFWSRREA
jgi:hypothetical protein